MRVPSVDATICICITSPLQRLWSVERLPCIAERGSGCSRSTKNHHASALAVVRCSGSRPRGWPHVLSLSPMRPVPLPGIPECVGAVSPSEKQNNLPVVRQAEGMSRRRTRVFHARPDGPVVFPGIVEELRSRDRLVLPVPRVRTPPVVVRYPHLTHFGCNAHATEKHSPVPGAVVVHSVLRARWGTRVLLLRPAHAVPNPRVVELCSSIAASEQQNKFSLAVEAHRHSAAR